MKNHAYRWLENIIRLQEKRGYSTASILCFAGFVAVVRLLEEWALGHRPTPGLAAEIVQYVAFYLMCFFTYTAGMRLLVPQPWRITINVILIGIFCGILPPLIDVVASGPSGFRYSAGLLMDWRIGIYQPQADIPLGEAAVLWFTILLCGLYVWIKTESLVRAVLGLLIGYLVVLFNISLLYTAALYFYAVLSPKQTSLFDMSTWLLTVTLVLYLVLQVELARGLARRLNHALPFGLIFLAGAAFAGPVDGPTAAQSLLPLLGFAVAIAQNDYFDRVDDARQGRPRYLDREDVIFLNAVFLLYTLNWIQLGSLIGAGMLIFFVVSVLYNYPFYRAKRFFPANLKIEGVWGLSACFMGVVATMEAGRPVTGQSLTPVTRAELTATFDWPMLIFMALVFGGWSLVASLKDYKDIRADLRAGVQTLYTLAIRRGWGLRRVHIAAKLLVGVCFLLPVPLLFAIGRVPLIYSIGGVAASCAVFVFMSAAPSARRYEWCLAVTNLYLAYLVALLIGCPAA